MGAYQPSEAQRAADVAALAQLKERLNRDVNSLIPRLYPAAVRAGHFWEIGNVDGDKGQSLKINADGNRIGIWTDFAGDGLDGRPAGDMLSLVVHRLYAGDFGAAMKALRAEHGLLSVSSDQAQAWQRDAAVRRAKAEADAAQAMKAKASRAKHLWLGAVPIKGTPAQAYLEGRGIDFGLLGGIPGALRYRPDVNFCPIRGSGPARTGYPAMLACVIASAPDNAGALVACHATFLDIDGWNHATKSGAVRVHKVVRAQSVDDQGECHYLPPALLDPANPVDGKIKSHKAVLGGFRGLGGYIPLRKGACGKTLADIPAGLIPRFSEGIEDGLSYAQMGHSADWIGAAVSLGNMAALVMPPQAGGIAFIADRNDNDDADAAWEAAVAAQQARFDDPAKVLAVWPRIGFSDFNNELQGIGL
jgi:hypothetical protein